MSSIRTQINNCNNSITTTNDELTRLYATKTSLNDMQSDMSDYYGKVSKHCSSVNTALGNEWEGNEVQKFEDYYNSAVDSLYLYTYDTMIIQQTLVQGEITSREQTLIDLNSHLNWLYSQLENE